MITTLVYRDSKPAGLNPSVESLAALRREPGVMLWIDLDQPSPDEASAILEKLFGFHPLAIEDCLAESSLPKLENYDDYLYLVAHAIGPAPDGDVRFTATKLDAFLGPGYLVTCHRRPLKTIQAVADRLRQSPSPVRGPDRILHQVLDSLVEGSQPILAALGHEVDRVENGVFREISADELFPLVVSLRKDLSRLRRLMNPQSQVIASLAAEKTKLIRPAIVPYLRDVGDDLARIETQAGAWADQLILSFRIYLNKSSHEANQGIKVITAITALTLPPLLVGGWFGMNFTGMRELGSRLGYPLAAAATLLSVLAMLLFMRRKRWI